MATTIEWTDETWNPVTGCSKVSPGCKNCYAETVANRFWKGRKFTDVWTHADRLDAPLHWRKPRRVFVNSMSDLFHEDVPDEFIDKVFAVMALAPQHTFQVLTKRPERMRDWGAVRGKWSGVWVDTDRRLIWTEQRIGTLKPTQWPLRNVWLGVSVEDQQRADERIPLLLQTPAAVRFLSCEPLLGPVDIGLTSPRSYESDCQNDGITWVIIGGESGHGARPCNIAWVRSLVEQCRAAGVACFVKQLGSDPFIFHPAATENGHPLDADFNQHLRDDGLLNDKKGGDPEEWPADLRVREFPAEAR